MAREPGQGWGRWADDLAGTKEGSWKHKLRELAQLAGHGQDFLDDWPPNNLDPAKIDDRPVIAWMEQGENLYLLLGKE